MAHMETKEMVVPQMVHAIVQHTLVTQKPPLLSWRSSSKPSKIVQVAAVQTEVQAMMAQMVDQPAMMAQLVVETEAQLEVAAITDYQITTLPFSTHPLQKHKRP